METYAKRPVKSVAVPELLETLRRAVERGAGFMAHQALNECGRIFRSAIATGGAERDIAADLRGALIPRVYKHFSAVKEPKAIGKLLFTLESYKGTFTVRCALRFSPWVFVRPVEVALWQWMAPPCGTDENAANAHRSAGASGGGNSAGSSQALRSGALCVSSQGKHGKRYSSEPNQPCSHPPGGWLLQR